MQNGGYVASLGNREMSWTSPIAVAAMAGPMPT